MYLMPEMIDMPLNLRWPRKIGMWPSNAHRRVAQRVAIGNPRVKSMDMLSAVVTAVNKVPKNRIRSVTAAILVDEFGMPDVM